MYLRRQNDSEAQDTPQSKVGPIPLPLFIALCVFGPSMAAFIVWFIYQNTVKRARNKKARAAQEEARIAEEKLQETHINHFLTNEIPGGK